MISPLFRSSIRNFAPQERPRMLAWCARHLTMPGGRPYDHAAYPHMGAPGGPCDAFDDPVVREISLQWGARLGKSAFATSAMCLTAATTSAPMMFATATRELAKDFVTTKVYPMVEAVPGLASRLRLDGRRPFTRIDLGTQRIYVGWARSPATLADKSAKVGHASEISKWHHTSTSNEADPLDLFDERFKEFPLRKVIKESTPTVAGRCRIEAAVKGSTNCRLYVPCPHCGKYQSIRFGDGHPGGIVFDKTPGGRLDPALAAKTARYVCASCEADIWDQHRAGMMRRGVWVPEGCSVNSDAAAVLFHDLFRPDVVFHEALLDRYQWTGWASAPWVIGTPLRDGPFAGYQLASLYSLALSWGDIAHKFAGSKGAPQRFRNFINSWCADTWKVERREEDWERLAAKLVGPAKREFVPRGHSLVTVGIDKQQSHYVWIVEAWAAGRVSAVIAYGTSEHLADLERDVLDKDWPHDDGGTAVVASLALIDGGYAPVEPGGLNLYEWAMTRTRRGRRTFVCKGSNRQLGTPYKLGVLKEGTSMPGAKIVHVDTCSSQQWLEDQLNNSKRGEPGSTSLFAAEPFEHRDLLEQWLNDAPVEDVDRQNNVTVRWERVDGDVPNDLRDAKRYADTAMLVETRGGPIRTRQPHPPIMQSAPRRGMTMPDGRPFLVSDRRD